MKKMNASQKQHGGKKKTMEMLVYILGITIFNPLKLKMFNLLNANIDTNKSCPFHIPKKTVASKEISFQNQIRVSLH